MREADPIELVYSLIGYPSETEWLEFKEGNPDAVRIGKDISALANAAAYSGRDCAYRVWGVEDGTRRVVGTTFDYLVAKAQGNQGLSIWLKNMLSPNANYEFSQFDCDIDGETRHFVVLKIFAACDQPVYFQNVAYIREGSSTTPLVSGSAKEAELWRRLQRVDFEMRNAIEDVRAEEVQDLLAIEGYFELLGLRKPLELETMLASLVEQEILHRQDNGRFAISNLGALLLARKLSDCTGLRKKALRVVLFAGKGNFEILDERLFDEGYALALQKAERYIAGLVPAEEVLEGAFRRVREAYPQKAVRELLVNAVVHQDLTVSAAGPLVCLYENRIEFNNPGSSLIPFDRVLNAQPKTRNGALASLLRRMDLCEEGGTGWDLAVAACEERHMLAPRIEGSEEMGVKATLFRGGAYGRMTKKERVDALYWHCCLMYAQGDSMSNQSLRERFGLSFERKNTLAMSRLIRECCDSGLIKEEDEAAGAKYKRYVPAWA